MEFIKKVLSLLIVTILNFLTVFTVNSACILINYQDKEPESLSRLKRIK